MTDYARRTATAARITRARQEEARRRRAESRRLYGPSTGGPGLRRERALSVFPGFPPLYETYRRPLTRAQATLAKVRDLATRAGRWAA